MGRLDQDVFTLGNGAWLKTRGQSGPGAGRKGIGVNQVNSLESICSAFLNRLRRPRRVEQEIVLQVSNPARQTVLAKCMEVAERGEKRRKGLLGRQQLASGEGLWILPCEAVHTFGMRFSIDLVYLDKKHRIKKLRSNVPPWRVSACLSAYSVLELAPGTIQQSQSKLGDQLEFSSAFPSGHGAETNRPPEDSSASTKGSR